MDPEEIARDLTDAILREPDGDEIAKIDSVDFDVTGQTLFFKVNDYGVGKKFGWTIGTQRVIDEAGSEAARDVRSAVMNLYTRNEGDRSVLGGGGPVGSGPPGPGDPELDL